MKRFFFIIVTLAFAAAVITTDVATAKPGKSGGSSAGQKGGNTSGMSKSSNKNSGGNKGHGHGHRFGRDYRNWSRYCWFPDYGCYGFCSGDDCEWYYWYEPAESYLPVGQMNEFRPTGAPPMTPNLPPGAVPTK